MAVCYGTFEFKLPGELRFIWRASLLQMIHAIFLCQIMEALVLG